MFRFRFYKTVCLILWLIIWARCSDDSESVLPLEEALKISVVSDLHYYAPELGTSGTAFESTLASDRKMLAESDAICGALIDSLIQAAPTHLLICGDLTKDGEELCHTRLIAHLQRLALAGIQVWVTPGNHDINNPLASRYEGAQRLPVASITPDQFARLYEPFGYSQAICRDSASLSYLAELSADLCLLSMDACQYRQNGSYPISHGALSVTTRNWAVTQLDSLHAMGKKTWVMMHHGLIEHFNGQKQYFDDYVVDDGNLLANEWAERGVGVVFTGHFHAQDVVQMVTASNSLIYDVETGSLVTWPCPFRHLEYYSETGEIKIETHRIQQISQSVPGNSFPEYAEQFLVQGITELGERILLDDYQMDSALVEQMLPMIGKTLKAHFQGDESADLTTITFILGLKLYPDPRAGEAAAILEALWYDPPPADNSLIILGLARSTPFRGI